MKNSLDDKKYGGFISRICLGDTYYDLKCEIVEVHAITCPKCGAPLELHYGEGKCSHCDTYFTTKFSVVEK